MGAVHQKHMKSIEEVELVTLVGIAFETYFLEDTASYVGTWQQKNQILLIKNLLISDVSIPGGLLPKL